MGVSRYDLDGGAASSIAQRSGLLTPAAIAWLPSHQHSRSFQSSNPPPGGPAYRHDLTVAPIRQPGPGGIALCAGHISSQRNFQSGLRNPMGVDASYRRAGADSHYVRPLVGLGL